jgi:hypothetical protein
LRPTLDIARSPGEGVGMLVPDSLPGDTPELLGVEFFTKLAEIDEEIAGRVAAAGCPVCGGPLAPG